MDVYAKIDSRSHLVKIPDLDRLNITVYMKREDEIHPIISGNKWRKLKYNVQHMHLTSQNTLVTFGGAFSNHIAAVAEVCGQIGISGIGIVRGERHEPLNSTLSFAESRGMELHFVSRGLYKDSKSECAERIMDGKDYYLIPEGGANELGVKGCEEILTDDERKNFDMITCSAGTGTTSAGLLRTLGEKQSLMVYSALKGDFLYESIIELSGLDDGIGTLDLTDDYCFGGYAKTNEELFDFITDFYKSSSIKLDPIYTGKMMYGLVEDCKKGRIEQGTRVLAIHTGGLQGIEGVERRDNVTLFTK
ncbi:MAG: pyridoxal-phosphate dependent enzyme [Flavobacteriales bacterium]|nr:pyridoxal-phosphate dependent enzyme [Flavobacteriales bacterium]